MGDNEKEIRTIYIVNKMTYEDVTLSSPPGNVKAKKGRTISGPALSIFTCVSSNYHCAGFGAKMASIVWEAVTLVNGYEKIFIPTGKGPFDRPSTVTSSM